MSKHMKEKKLAVCIPTYNRPEVMDEFFETAVHRYLDYGFDIYIYDSSEGKQTEVVLEKWKQCYKRVHYVRVSSKIHSNRKVYDIFREFGEKNEYDYLWVCSDSIRWNNQTLETISNELNKGYDLIIPNYRDVERIGTREYLDKNELFLDCAWHMTLYGAVIIKVSTMLQEVDWDMLINKYMVPECINHSHVAFYFEKLCTMDCFSAIHISFQENALIASSLKKNSGWKKETFYVWCTCFPEMIQRLPECYQNKKRVIKKSGVNSKILSYPNIRQLRMEGIFDNSIYEHYKKEWPHLTNVPRLLLWCLAYLPKRVIKYLDLDTIRTQIKLKILKKRIKNFCHNFDDIYIYGAGIKAKRYTQYLDEMEIPFKAYLITNPTDNIRTLNGHDVIAYQKGLIEGKRAGILLALNEGNTKDVLKNTLYSIETGKVFNEYGKNFRIR